MENLNRCKCSNLPEVKIENQDNGYSVEMFCALDGWRASGKSLEQAKEHWNIFVAFMTKQAA